MLNKGNKVAEATLLSDNLSKPEYVVMRVGNGRVM